MKTFLVVVLVAACWLASPSAESQTSDTRDRLTVRELFDGRVPTIVHNDYFKPMGAISPPSHRFSGLVHFSETQMATALPDSDWQGSGQTVFPGFSVSLIGHDGDLIPLERGIILAGERDASIWNVIVSPGHVWNEPGDAGYSRAALPFTLTNNAIGQARNGIATFVYNDGESSRVAIQITQETAPVDTYTRTELHASVPARYEPRVFDDEARVVEEFENELAARLPVRPWSELPDADLARSRFNDDTIPSDLSAGALLIDGVLYVQSVPTRVAGPYPYPESMRHGVFSVTKTLSMAVSMFYVAHKFDDAVFDTLITDYVPILTVDEAAKIALLLNNEGRLGELQLLSPTRIREALSPSVARGYDTGGNQSYFHSVWRRPANLPRCVVHVPTMSGHGGSLVMMLTNGLVAIRFADDNDYDVTPMVHATELYRSPCR